MIRYGAFCVELTWFDVMKETDDQILHDRVLYKYIINHMRLFNKNRDMQLLYLKHLCLLYRHKGEMTDFSLFSTVYGKRLVRLSWLRRQTTKHHK